MVSAAKETFIQKYPDAKNMERSFCPYRICPLGAHVDHQYGLIAGFAIDEGIEMFYESTDDGLIEVLSLNMDGTINFSIYDEKILLKRDWADYLRGAIVSLKRRYNLTKGIRGVLYGSMPIGGLSSSAAVIICFLKAICKVNNLHPSSEEVIDIALYAEKDYVGVNVGTLDQSCEILSEKDRLLFLDTRTGKYEVIPQSKKMPEYEFAVFFSGVPRSLVGSAFNMRVDECKAAAYALKGFSGMEYGKFDDTRLRDVPKEVFDKYRTKLPKNWRLRATHFYSECERVEKGVEYWKKGDIIGFGKQIFKSGDSSINYYQTGSPELKALYTIMLETDGIYGGRFSGAGFKGCCMAIIDPKYKESINKTVTEKYLKQFPHLKNAFSVHFCKSAEGVKF
ncbi:MAG: galactokinase family protein [Eubacteriales bacterium]|nr:galactokinase family protein [Eubacteriales bacterium]